MITLVPNYYKKFKCIANKCRHSCCIGWEIDIDEEALERFNKMPDVKAKIEDGETPHFALDEKERCPFLRGDGLCEMIINHGEEALCQICRDHPRFRNFWTGITEIGLGLVCEEAARIILFSDEPMTLTVLDGEKECELPEDEKWLWDLRDEMLKTSDKKGVYARLYEYLVFRHLPDALYDGMVEERIRFINDAFDEIVGLWKKTNGKEESLIDAVRKWSYDVEYDDEVIQNRLLSYQ